MTNKQLQELLKTYPDEMPIKLLTEHQRGEIIDLTEESVLHTSTTAVYHEAEEDDEQDFTTLGDGEQYLLFNPVIV